MGIQITDRVEIQDQEYENEIGIVVNQRWEHNKQLFTLRMPNGDLVTAENADLQKL